VSRCPQLFAGGGAREFRPTARQLGLWGKERATRLHFLLSSTTIHLDTWMLATRMLDGCYCNDVFLEAYSHYLNPRPVDLIKARDHIQQRHRTTSRQWKCPAVLANHSNAKSRVISNPQCDTCTDPLPRSFQVRKTGQIITSTGT
jgi:hypothetical protein